MKGPHREPAEPTPVIDAEAVYKGSGDPMREENFECEARGGG